jgi:hypothetical protein
MVGNFLQRMELWVCKSRVRKPPRQLSEWQTVGFSDTIQSIERDADSNGEPDRSWCPLLNLEGCPRLTHAEHTERQGGQRDSHFAADKFRRAVPKHCLQLLCSFQRRVFDGDIECLRF